MQILPATTLADLSASFADTLSDNAAIIVGIIGLAVGIVFVVRWFNKGTRRIKP